MGLAGGGWRAGNTKRAGGRSKAMRECDAARAATGTEGAGSCAVGEALRGREQQKENAGGGMHTLCGGG